MEITSLSNNRIKELLKLKERKGRKEEHLFLIEGEHLVEEAYKKGILKELILIIGNKITQYNYKKNNINNINIKNKKIKL